MSKLTDECLNDILQEVYGFRLEQWELEDGGGLPMTFARAIEAAATEPLLQRIAELEKALKLVQQHHATAWNRGHIAGMAANRMVAQDALNAVKKDAWNNTQLTEALMAAEARCEELERQLEEARKDAERYRWIRKQHWSENLLGVVVRPKDQTKLGSMLPSMELLDDTIDHMSSEGAAMQKGQP